MDSISVFSIASQQAQYLAVRQTAIASNIANAEVPTYQAKDTGTFAAVLNQAETGLSLTNARHISASDELNGISLKSSGKRVALETELVKSAEVQTSMQLNTGVVSAFHSMFLMTVK